MFIAEIAIHVMASMFFLQRAVVDALKLQVSVLDMLRVGFFVCSLLLSMCFGADAVLAEPVNIAADEINRTADGVVVARGSVVIKRQWDTLMADQVIYRSAQHVLEAKGHVIIRSDKATITSDEAVMQTQSNTGYMKHAVITLPGGERLVSEHVKRVDDQTYEATHVIFSSCPIDAESWRVAARRAVIDQQSGAVTVQDARFELWHVPVLYSPWWQQPLRRKTGLLLPFVASGKRRGTEFLLPLYIAPQDNWDATLTPHWMSARGMMMEAEARHASVVGTESINLATIQDKVTGTRRSRVGSDLHWRLPDGLAFNASIDHVSDSLFVADYVTNQQLRASYLQSNVALSQAVQLQDVIGSWSLSGAYSQSLLQPSNANVLQILPRLESHVTWNANPNLLFGFDQQSTRFSRQQGVKGWRVNLHPFVEVPWSLDGGGVSARVKAGVQHTRYGLQQSALVNTHPTRTSGDVGVEVRADFEKIGGTQEWRHVVSPVLRYSYVSAPNQSQLPNFDSAFAALTLGNLLSGNRFSGLDRIERTSRVAVLLENRVQVKNDVNQAARDVLIVRAGLTYDLMQTSVDATLQARQTRPFSNLLAEVAWTPTPTIRVYGSGEYDSSAHLWPRLYTSLALSGSDSKLGVVYQSAETRRARLLQIVLLNARAGLGGRWKATASLQYDLLLKLSQQTAIGLRYEHPCWMFGLEAYKTNSPRGTSQAANYGYRLLLEFKGLGSVGS